MNILFDKIVIQNFLSIGQEPVIVEFLKGINFITGFNKDQQSRNGVGKTSIVAAIFFALYGEIDRSMKKSAIANNRNADTCSVDLTFYVDNKKYRIVRMLRPSKLFLYIDDEDKSKTIPETDLDILKILGNTTKEVFEQTVVMSSNNVVPFLAQKNANKVEFIEGILSLGFFGELLDKARKRFNATDKLLATVESKYNTLLTQYETQKGSYKNFETNRKDDLNILNSEKDKILKEIEKLKAEETPQTSVLLEEKVELLARINYIESQTEEFVEKIVNDIKRLEEQIENTNKETTELSESTITKKEELYEKLKLYGQKEDNANKIRYSIMGELGEVKAEINQKTKEIDKLNSQQTHCPTCKQPYKDLDPSHFENLKKEMENELVPLKEKEQKVLDKKAEFEIKYEKLKNAQIDVNSKISELDSDLNKIRTQQNEKTKKIQTEISSLRKQIDDRKISDKSKITTINQDIREKDGMIEKAKEKDNIIKMWEDKSSSKDKEIEKLNNKENPFKQIILDMRETIKEAKKELEDIKYKKTVLDNVKYVVSPEGLKAYIIKKIIKLFNQRLDFYLKRLNAPCTCVFNEFFEERLLDVTGQEISYANLSGGEKKRLDVAMLFTFRDIRKHQTGITFNISVFDEIFDSAIDSTGMDKIMGILADAVENYDEAFYVVTHRKENVDYDNVKVIELVKEKGYTRRVA